MPGQSFSFNAYEASLASLVSAEATTIALDSVAGLGPNGYLVIDPASPSLREYIYYTSINGLNLEGCQRGLAGSIIQGFGVAHDAGIKIRAVPVHQHLDDLWGDNGIKGVSDGLTDHETDSNAHSIEDYLKKSGGLMTGDLQMGAEIDMLNNYIRAVPPPATDDHAANKKYVDDSQPVDTSKVIYNTDSPYTALSTDEVLIADSSSGAITVNLPSAISNVTKSIIVIALGGPTAGNVTISRAGTDSLFDLGTYYQSHVIGDNIGNSGFWSGVGAPLPAGGGSGYGWFVVGTASE